MFATPISLSKEHAEIIWKWRNDPLTRQMSFYTEIQSWSDFWERFKKNYNNRHSYFIYIMHQVQPVAYVCFDTYPKSELDSVNSNLFQQHGVWSIGLNLNPDYRGKKLSSDIVKCAILYFIQDMAAMRAHKVSCIIAEIKIENIASIKCFERNKFVFLDQTTKILNQPNDNEPVDKVEIFRYYYLI